MEYSRKYTIYIITLLSLAVILPIIITIDYRDKPIIILSDTDFENFRFSGSGVIDDPYLIENLRMKQTKNNGQIDYGIYIFNTTKYFIIRNCEITDFEGGIYLRSIANGTAIVESNKIFDCNFGFAGGMSCSNSESLIIRNNLVVNSDISISIVECDNSIIANNTCYYNRVGTYVTGSHYVTVSGNNCTFNGWGHVNLASNYTKIFYNSFSNNYAYGIEPDPFTKGSGLSIYTCYFVECFNNTITGNPESGIEAFRLYNSTVSFNNCSYNRRPKYIDYWGYGIDMIDSTNNTFIYNLFERNGEYGIFFDNSSNNIFHHNAFFDNGDSVEDSVFVELDAFESPSLDNIWYKTSTLQGNFWKGWNTSIPFTIQGSLDTDPYPLEENPVELELYLIFQEG